MASAKYKKYFNDMFLQNRDLFMQFKILNDDFAKDKKKHAEKFNQVGKQVLEIIHEWEQRLCGHMEKGEYSVYSANLSEKYWSEVRSYFPYVDFVGVKIK
jgi:hypothetical protein